MENDLISRSRLLACVEKAYKHVCENNALGVFSTTARISTLDYNLIKSQPAVDAVEVVYCGECQHSDTEDMTGWLWCNEWQSASNCGGYCHKGERRADDV